MSLEAKRYHLYFWSSGAWYPSTNEGSNYPKGLTDLNQAYALCHVFQYEGAMPYIVVEDLAGLPDLPAPVIEVLFPY